MPKVNAVLISTFLIYISWWGIAYFAPMPVDCVDMVQLRVNSVTNLVSYRIITGRALLLITRTQSPFLIWEKDFGRLMK